MKKEKNNEREVLERVERLVRPQIISEGELNTTSPSFLDIYNVANEELRIAPTGAFVATCESFPENSLTTRS